MALYLDWFGFYPAERLKDELFDILGGFVSCNDSVILYLKFGLDDIVRNPNLLFKVHQREMQLDVSNVMCISRITM